MIFSSPEELLRVLPEHAKSSSTTARKGPLLSRPGSRTGMTAAVSARQLLSRAHAKTALVRQTGPDLWGMWQTKLLTQARQQLAKQQQAGVAKHAVHDHLSSVLRLFFRQWC
ncbi:MAG: hypothetical protein FRX49_13172 [Trebouxia sp. A1-2]|nr:MAG: hypothetical protein FRX49_13172 [Trebouxia sp. A1-2]